MVYITAVLVILVTYFGLLGLAYYFREPICKFAYKVLSKKAQTKL